MLELYEKAELLRIFLVYYVYACLLNWREEPLSFQEELTLQQMRYSGSRPKNRGEFRDLWSKYLKDKEPKNDMEIDLFHMTSVNNLESILIHGLLSGSETEKLGIVPDHVSNSEIVERRKLKQVDDTHTLWDYALLYFQPRNAMLYQIIRDNSIAQKIIVLRFSYNVSNGGFFSTKNAVLADAFYRLDDVNKKQDLERTVKLILKEGWDNDAEKTRMMAEALIPQKLGSENLREIFYYDQNLLFKIRGKIPSNYIVQITSNKRMFFK